MSSSQDTNNQALKMPNAEDRFIQTLNQHGWMTTSLDPYSKAFVDYAPNAVPGVLEIGAAYGIASLAVIRNGGKIVANDLDFRHLKILTDQVPAEMRNRLILLPGEFPYKVPLIPDSFGAVLACRVFHFFSPKTIEASIRALYSALVRGGKAFVIADSPFMKVFQGPICQTYLERNANGDPWPGYFPDVHSHLPKDRETKLPKTFHVLDPVVLSRAFNSAGFHVEKAEFIDRKENYPDRLILDGRGKCRINCGQNMSGKVFVLSNDPLDLSFVSAVATHLQLPLETSGTNPQESDLIFFSASDKPLPEAKSPNIHAIVAPGQLEKAESLLMAPGICSIIARRFRDPQREGKNFARILKDAGSPQPIGLSGFESPFKYTMQETAQREYLSEMVSMMFTRLGCQERVASMLANMTDELLMNAVFDAPVETNGKRVFEGRERAGNISLDADHLVDLEIAMDENYIGVCVTDRYGSLERESLVRHLTSAFSQRENKLNKSKTNSGIGLAQSFTDGASFRFRWKPGVFTEASLYCENTKRMVDFRSQMQFVFLSPVDVSI